MNYEIDPDPAVCRLQFPDGSVPSNATEAAQGWHRVASEARDALTAANFDLSALLKEVERLENANAKLRERALNAEHDLAHFRVQPHDQEFSA